MTDNDPNPMGDQPMPPNALPAFTPDWQQIAILLMLRFLPAESVSVELTVKDHEALMAAYPGGPVVAVSPTLTSMKVALMTVEAATKLSEDYNASLPRLQALEPEQNAPGSDVVQ